MESGIESSYLPALQLVDYRSPVRSNRFGTLDFLL
jgi:hypothetical protein